MQKKVLIFVPSLSGGGQERIAALTADCLKEKNDVTVVLFTDKCMAYRTQCEVINLNLPSKTGILAKTIQQLRRIRKLREIRKKICPDIVYSFGNTANITNVFSSGIGKTIVSIRGYANLKYSKIDWYVYKSADIIICISHGMKDKLNKLYPFTKDKTFVIYNGLDINDIRDKANSEEGSIALPSGIKFISVGRLENVKGFRHLIKSFAILKNKNVSVSLIILGDGSIRDELIILARQLNVENSVYFLGFQNNPYIYMKQCDVFVMSSINEGFGNVIVEAMACGLPIISTACLSGPAEILDSKDYNIHVNTYTEYGILVPAFKSDILEEVQKEQLMADAMYNIINDDNLRSKYARLSVLRAEKFSIDECSKNTERIFDY